MSSISEEANKLADFILFTQRSCILNLSSELNEGKVSYPQFFLLTYLASEDFLSMSSIAQKWGILPRPLPAWWINYRKWAT